MEEKAKAPWTNRGRRVCAARRSVAGAIASLQIERESLEEEVRQLRAAIQVYTAVAQRLARAGSATLTR